MSYIDTLEAELKTHSLNCRCATKLLCETREEWLAKEITNNRNRADFEFMQNITPDSMTSEQLYEMQFMECDACRAKPGAPVLCRGCLHNRSVIAKLEKVPRSEIYAIVDAERLAQDKVGYKGDNLKKEITDWIHRNDLQRGYDNIDWKDKLEEMVPELIDTLRCTG